MWPILGPLESNQTHRSINFNHIHRSLFTGDPIRQNSSSKRILIKSNIRYLDPISSTCLIIYAFVLLLLSVLPIFAWNICLRQIFE